MNAPKYTVSEQMNECASCGQNINAENHDFFEKETTISTLFKSVIYENRLKVHCTDIQRAVLRKIQWMLIIHIIQLEHINTLKERSKAIFIIIFTQNVVFKLVSHQLPVHNSIYIVIVWTEMCVVSTIWSECQDL